MPTSAYFVTVQTRDEFPGSDYAEIAGQLTNALHTTLGEPSNLCTIVHSTEITDPRVEVEIMQSKPSSTAHIMARCVVQADALTKLVFDKNLFTNMLSAELTFPVKISKRVVTKDELMAAEAGLTDEPPPEEAA